jgi:hypothetical protein
MPVGHFNLSKFEGFRKMGLGSGVFEQVNIRQIVYICFYLPFHNLSPFEDKPYGQIPLSKLPASLIFWQIIPGMASKSKKKINDFGV